MLHESAISQNFERLESGSQILKLSEDAESKYQEAMPTKARAVKNAEEVKTLLAQGVTSDSAFIYDTWGRLSQITESDGSVRQFVYIGDKMAEERDGTGAVTKRFYEWGQLIGSTKYFYNRDHLGSVRELMDISGNVVASYGYDPFGQVTKLTGSGVDSDFLFAGYFYHRPSKLYITAHRLYSPKLGRWLSRDPIDEVSFAMSAPNPESFIPAARGPLNQTNLRQQGISNDPIILAPLAKVKFEKRDPELSSGDNLYAYARNNPASYTDPSGLIACPANNDGPSYEFCKKYCKRICQNAMNPVDCYDKCIFRCMKGGK